jgi:hypothetical protein
MEVLQSSWANLVFLVVAVLVAWIVLRFMLRVTARIVRVGCLAIFLVIGVVVAVNAVA